MCVGLFVCPGQRTRDRHCQCEHVRVQLIHHKVRRDTEFCRMKKSSAVKTNSSFGLYQQMMAEFDPPQLTVLEGHADITEYKSGQSLQESMWLGKQQDMRLASH